GAATGYASCLAVNGRLLNPRVLVDAGIAPGETLVDGHGTPVASWIAPTAPSTPPRTIAAALARAPWDLTSAVAATLEADLAVHRSGLLASCVARHLRPDEGQSFGTHPILIDPSAVIGPLCVIDASKGPVVIGKGVVVRPLSVLVGPCAVLEGSTVAERALLKANTVIGPQCRAGGEIGGTIFQAHSNKSHDGHLGDSFVGEWVNIGAGTDNSNLLNTYGEVIVRLEPDGGLMKTGRQFWGSILGDHVKLAIGTRLMTGTTVGTGAMIAQSTPPASLVARFAWCVDGAPAPPPSPQVTADGAVAPRAFRFEKFMDTARAMMSRRGRTPGPALEAALRALHAKATGA
ncbi:MAG: hypothetical protein ACO3QC_13855, partial [Phycisphaerales bacterium]